MVRITTKGNAMERTVCEWMRDEIGDLVHAYGMTEKQAATSVLEKLELPGHYILNNDDRFTAQTFVIQFMKYL